MYLVKSSYSHHIIFFFCFIAQFYLFYKLIVVANMLLSSPHDDDLFKLNGLKVYYPVNESIIEQDMSSCLASQTGSLPLGYAK